MNGERPCWPIAPSGGRQVSGVKELSESCWNSDPAQRPTAQAIVEALTLVIDQNDTLPEVLRSSEIMSNADISAAQETSKKAASAPHDTVMTDRVPATAAAGHRIEDGLDPSKLRKRFSEN
jgi:hypothetical protein